MEFIADNAVASVTAPTLRNPLVPPSHPIAAYPPTSFLYALGHRLPPVCYEPIHYDVLRGWRVVVSGASSLCFCDRFLTETFRCGSPSGEWLCVFSRLIHFTDSLLALPRFQNRVSGLGIQGLARGGSVLCFYIRGWRLMDSLHTQSPCSFPMRVHRCLSFLVHWPRSLSSRSLPCVSSPIPVIFGQLTIHAQPPSPSPPRYHHPDSRFWAKWPTVKCSSAVR